MARTEIPDGTERRGAMTGLGGADDDSAFASKTGNNVFSGANTFNGNVIHNHSEVHNAVETFAGTIEADGGIDSESSHIDAAIDAAGAPPQLHYVAINGGRLVTFAFGIYNVGGVIKHTFSNDARSNTNPAMLYDGFNSWFLNGNLSDVPKATPLLDATHGFASLGLGMSAAAPNFIEFDTDGNPLTGLNGLLPIISVEAASIAAGHAKLPFAGATIFSENVNGDTHGRMTINLTKIDGTGFSPSIDLAPGDYVIFRFWGFLMPHVGQ